MESKYWLMRYDDEYNSSVSQSLSKKILRSYDGYFNGVRYNCYCGITSGKIKSDMDIFKLVCPRCKVMYLDEEDVAKIPDDPEHKVIKARL